MLKNREVFAKSGELFSETRALFTQRGGLSLQTRKKREQFVRAFLFYCRCRLENVIPLGLEPRTHALEGRCSNPTELRNQTFYEQSLGFAGANIAIFSVETINIARKITFIRRNLVRVLGHASIYAATSAVRTPPPINRQWPPTSQPGPWHRNRHLVLEAPVRRGIPKAPTRKQYRPPVPWHNRLRCRRRTMFRSGSR